MAEMVPLPRAGFMEHNDAGEDRYSLEHRLADTSSETKC